MPMHICRYYFWKLSMGKLVDVSKYIFVHVSVYTFIFIHIYRSTNIYMLVDLYMCMNKNVHVCPYICAYNALICILWLYSIVRMPLVLNCAISLRFNITFSKYVLTVITMLVRFLLNALRAGSQHSVSRLAHTACVQIWHIPTLTVFVFSRQTPNKDHDEQLSPCLSLAQFCTNVKCDFIG